MKKAKGISTIPFSVEEIQMKAQEQIGSSLTQDEINIFFTILSEDKEWIGRKSKLITSTLKKVLDEQSW